QLRKTPDAREYRRALALLEAATGSPISHIARKLGIHRASIYHWIARYQQDPTPEVLADQPGSGRPSMWTEELESSLRECLVQEPAGQGYQATNCRVLTLAELLPRRPGRPLCDG